MRDAIYARLFPTDWPEADWKALREEMVAAKVPRQKVWKELQKLAAGPASTRPARVAQLRKSFARENR